MALVRTSLALAGLVGGGYLLLGGDAAVSAPPPAKARAVRSASLPSAYVAPRVLPALPVAPAVEIDEEIVDEEIVDEEILGHHPIEDASELAFVFSVDGVSYVRLSDEERAAATGRPRMIAQDGMHAVVASVTTDAMPDELRAWAGRSVLVDGTCRAKVVGFAEVSRVIGDASDPFDYDPGDGEVRSDRSWTIEGVIETGVVLAARLDDCAGSWARWAELSPAAIVARVDSPELEQAARADLLAPIDGDAIQDSWIEDGGTGDWRDAADVVTHVVHHPDTDEHWVFVQARRHGGCGEPGFATMAAYRANPDGTVRRMATLEFGAQDIHEVVDLDGDGQPELVLGGGDQVEVVDLLNARHASIDVPERHYGCGC